MISPLITFLIAGLATPGPNVIMLTTSGARFGARATWPHLIGVVLGVGVIGAVSGLGVGALLQANPKLGFTLQIISAVWILWMAFALLQQSKSRQSRIADRPMRMFEAVLFQWVNAKVWAVALAASSAYSIGLPPIEDAMRLGLAFSSVNLFVCIFWTYSGQLLARLLNSARAWWIFRLVMATFLALSALLIFI